MKEQLWFIVNNKSPIRFLVRDEEEIRSQKQHGAISSEANCSTIQNSAVPSGNARGPRTIFFFGLLLT